MDRSDATPLDSTLHISPWHGNQKGTEYEGQPYLTQNSSGGVVFGSRCALPYPKEPPYPPTVLPTVRRMDHSLPGYSSNRIEFRCVESRQFITKSRSDTFLSQNEIN